MSGLIVEVSGCSVLEIKRTSITRLKPLGQLQVDAYDQQSWNQKNLDYEIETR